MVTGKADIANARIEFESGCVANLTASRISTERVRKLRFFQPNEYISVDYTRQDVLQFRVAGNRSLSPEQLWTAAASSSVPIPGVTVNKPEIKPEEPLHAELKSFMNAVRQRSRPEVSLEDGREALAVAFQILDAIRQHMLNANLTSLMTP